LLTLDIAVGIDGWVADSAVSVIVGTPRDEDLHLIRATEVALEAAIEAAQPGTRLGDFVASIGEVAAEFGYTPNLEFGGHGIGRTMHENPQVPNYVDRETRKSDFKLEPGLTLAVEPMVNMRRAEVDTLGDQWTVVTRDRLASVHVEHTLALTASGVVIITADEGAFDDEPAPAPTPVAQ
jgi:methionyl aminopeptidase